jgi:hypothetical protein
VYCKKVNKNIFLEVLQGNERALKYYKKIGFKEFDECSISKTLVYEINDTAMAQTVKEKITLKDGSTYEGETKDGKPHGRGKQTWVDGETYEGDFANNVPHGKGKSINANGDVYEGGFSHNKYHGKGKKTYADGGASSGCAVEEGKWKDGKFMGKK